MIQSNEIRDEKGDFTTDIGKLRVPSRNNFTTASSKTATWIS